MNQKEFISACLKLMGLYLIIVGIGGIWENSCKYYVDYRNSYNSQKTEAFIRTENPQYKKEDSTLRAIVEFGKIYNQTMIFHGIFISAFKLLAGIYLCKGGTFVLNFLIGKEKILKTDTDRSTDV